MLSSFAGNSQNIKELYASANKSFELGYYLKALEYISPVINSKDQILEKKKAEINYMYAKGLLYLIETKNDSMASKLLLSEYTLPLTCYHSFEKAKSEDIILNAKIEKDLKSLYPFIIESADNALDKDLITYAHSFISIAQSIDQSNPKNNFVLAVLDIKKEDTLSAKELFAISTRDLNKADSIEAIYASESYYYLSIINNEFYKNPRIAIEKLTEANRIIDKMKLENTISESDYESLKSMYDSYMLDIYLNYPGNEEEAIIKFKESVEKTPKNYSLVLSLADLLSQNHKEEAITYYQKAIDIDPNNYIAYYNLGALYLNEGVNYYELSTQEKDSTIARQYYFSYQEKYAEAYGWMQMALEKDKAENLELLYALKRIAAGLYYPDDYQNYEMMITKIVYRISIKGK